MFSVSPTEIRFTLLVWQTVSQPSINQRFNWIPKSITKFPFSRWSFEGNWNLFVAAGRWRVIGWLFVRHVKGIARPTALTSISTLKGWIIAWPLSTGTSTGPAVVVVDEYQQTVPPARQIKKRKKRKQCLLAENGLGVRVVIEVLSALNKLDASVGRVIVRS